MTGEGIEATRAIVLLGDVVGSRRVPGVGTTWLRRLCTELDSGHADDRLAPFAFTQGNELQGLLLPGADPVRGVLYVSLHEGVLPMRWAIVHGSIEPGTGLANERTGEAYVLARHLVEAARRQRDGLVMVTGHAPSDALLRDLSPVLAELVLGLSSRQRTVARLVLLDGLRQAEVAERLDVSRATVSVTFGRAGIRSIERVASAVRALFRAGVEASAAAALA
jgi:DNA-binding CsgD family transcriptional regulator